MRRVWMTLLAVALVLSACGTGGSDTSSSTVQPGSPTTTEGGTTSTTTGADQPATTTTVPVSSSTTTTSTVPASSTTTTVQPGLTEVRVYLMLDDTGETSAVGPSLVPVARHVDRTVGVAAAAMEALLKGPTGEEATSIPALSTTIPSDARFLGVRVSDGVATVNLSKEFESGGGTFSMGARLAQVVYTLTQFPTIDEVAFELDGERVTVFSSEGLVIDEPLGRADQQEFLPAVFVDSPAYAGSVADPARITGVSNVFEARFTIAIVDNDGLILAEEPVQASCGTGCWGSFDVTIDYDVDEAQMGGVIVWVYSPKDGSQIDVREYPVWLTP
ncbi:MAG: GerMN domain-containing protein [Acidimicrobiia bacterium]|nr:GerMN domain-containing protein [Acidimicrobiia bacterium]